MGRLSNWLLVTALATSARSVCAAATRPDIVTDSFTAPTVNVTSTRVVFPR
jgi:hypothetical protein